MRQVYRWGVDSATAVTESLYECVMENFGFPFFWGRYLKEIPGRNAGLTKSEVQLLHSRGTKILPIYNAFDTATGYREGTVAASNAIFYARKLGVPKDTVIFGNIEYYFSVDANWIQGWVETFYTSGFRPGLYASQERGDFAAAYCEAVRTNKKVANQLIIWAQDPVLQPKGPQAAPSFQPAGLPCQANIWVWQFGKVAEACPVDTNLALKRLLDHLW